MKDAQKIILIALDTLRADHMGCYGYGYGHATSPFMDEIAKQGVLFEDFYAPAIPTQPSYTTVFTGLYSITHGIVSHGGQKPLSGNVPWLPEILKQSGYTTCAIDNLGRMKPWFHRGYEFYIDPPLKYHSMQLVSAEQINHRAISWLKSHAGEDFFMFVHYWDPHTPYLPPEGYRRRFYKGDPFDPKNTSMVDFCKSPHGITWCHEGGWIHELGAGKRITDAGYIASLYDGEISYLDEHLAHFLSTLDELNISEETLLIFFADHGEILDGHPGVFDHHGLYDANIHVPLIMRWPKRFKPGMRLPHLVQHVDLAPTILQAAGLKAPEKMEGKSLLSFIEGKETQPYYDRLITQECTYQAKWAIRREDCKLIVSREEKDIHGLPPLELYDLKRDPDEQVNICEQELNRVNSLKEELESWVAQMMRKNGLKQDPLVDQKAPLGKNWKAWVEKHGYW